MASCPNCGAPIAGAHDAWCAHCGVALPASHDDPAVAGSGDASSAPWAGWPERAGPEENSPAAPDDRDQPGGAVGAREARHSTSPAPDISATGIACIQCGYDVSGTALGAVCPECGTPVMDSIPRPPLPGLTRATASGLPSSSLPGWSLGLGLLSLCCSPVGIAAVILGVAARRAIREGRCDPAGGGTALVGIVLGAIGTALFVGQLISALAR
ncbi:MAG: DUF4190 domain-containing protein [Phycisphaerales bacterium]